MRARLRLRVPGSGGAFGDFPLSPLASAFSFISFLAARAAARSALFYRISTLEGQASFRHSFQGRPR